MTRTTLFQANQSGQSACHPHAWHDFNGTAWRHSVDVRSFIQDNYMPFTGEPVFLAAATDRTKQVLAQVRALLQAESDRGGVLDIDTARVSSLLSYPPGYLDCDRERIVGLQTDAPLKRGVNPFGGIRMAQKACQDYGYELSDAVVESFRYRTTHNDGVFRVYTPEMRQIRRSGLITGLPDAYGRGRLIGDYRRVALYGVDGLIRAKQNDQDDLSGHDMDDETIRLLEELYRQIDFLTQLKEMAAAYGYDVSGPAGTAQEAVQWLYFAYLAAIKEQNGAAMSLGRISTFLDIYIERDILQGRLDESGAQELVDDLVIKLRLARQLRTAEYNDLFAGDPLWITEALGGMGLDGRTLVTKTTYRFLHALENLGTAPEPNLTVLWSRDLPDAFLQYCTGLTLASNALQYENDDLMRPHFGDDYAIACCVSAGRIGKDMQFFGARCNLPKLLLLAINGGRDEISGEQIGPVMAPVGPGPLDYDDLMDRYHVYESWLCRLYVRTMNIIHAMHDKYAYEKIQMALHDTDVNRYMSFGVAGLSVAADSLSAVKHAAVTPRFGDNGLVTSFAVEGSYPCYGNDDNRADRIASGLCASFISQLRLTPCYRGASHTLSVLTITSNVVYGRKTGATPDGRPAGAPFAPGANPMHGREQHGALAALNSMAKLSYDDCRDGISCTLSLSPASLGPSGRIRSLNLTGLLAGFFTQSAQHLNVNVLDRATLEDAMAHPDRYPGLTIRVSGYAVLFCRLNREQQEEILKRSVWGPCKPDLTGTDPGPRSAAG